jgi:hypothetical protein
MKKIFCTAFVAAALIMGTSLPSQAGHFRGSIWIGGPLWGPVYPYPYYVGPPAIVQQPVIVQQPPTEYVQPAPRSNEQGYWYYCQGPKGYYPYVKKCPKGWMKVVPEPAPTGEED